jgi:queuosine precursor transporter
LPFALPSVPNEAIWFVMLVVNFLAILGMYRRLGLLGLYVWIPMAVIVANIQVVKTVELFGLTATLGNIAYASTFLATDIISENHGKAAANKAVWIGFMSIIAMTVFMNAALWYAPSPEDFAQEALSTIFGLMPRIALGSVAAYLISQKHDIWAYQFWKRRFPSDKAIWIRNNASTMVSQALDTVVFVAIAFWGQFPLPVLLEIFFTTYAIKWLVAVLDTPFMYAARYLYKKGLAGQEE